ncbi:MAG: branched-chain amino acid transport system substrate-binding protein, partial [Alphaproteobacteria bacterium]|nr:branched-chain amino acid transport system substrate-binding protein [Alphaproteobacteria bacterium]
QILAKAVSATNSLGDDTLAAYIRQTTFDTVIGPISFGADGEWTKPRIICIQFQGISGTDLEQFRDWSRQVVVYPRDYKSGNLLYPFERAAQ